MLSNSIRTVAAALLLSPAALVSQVFIVDAANGAGSHFSDLPAAVAAVPDGATLRVLPGSYSYFSIQGKGLRMLGEGSVSVDRPSGNFIHIAGIGASQTVLLRDIRVDGWMLVENAPGPVVLERCGNAGGTTTQAGIDIRTCGNVQLRGCDFVGNSGFFGGIIATASVVLIDDCRATGGEGTGSPFCPPPRGFQAICGGPGLRLHQSTGVLSRSRFVGGRGAAGWRSCSCCWAVDGGDGGYGCDFEGARVVMLGCSALGGPAGPGAWGSCGSTSPGSSGWPFRRVGSQLTNLVSSTDGEISNAQVRGSNILFKLHDSRTPPLSAVMVFSYRGDVASLEPFGLGAVLALPAAFIGPYNLSGNALQVPWTIPSGLQLGAVYFGQFIVLGSTGLIATNPFPLVVAR